jgi:hypothetical protein
MDWMYGSSGRAPALQEHNSEFNFFPPTEARKLEFIVVIAEM